MADSQDQTVVATVQEAPLSPREKFWVGFYLFRLRSYLCL